MIFKNRIEIIIELKNCYSCFLESLLHFEYNFEQPKNYIYREKLYFIQLI